MEAIKLAGLEPKAFMGYFEAICGIPHGSGNTKAISDYQKRERRFGKTSEQL